MTKTLSGELFDKNNSNVFMKGEEENSKEKDQ